MKTIKILHLEDNTSDAELIRTGLAREGVACEIELVNTRPEFEQSLKRGGFDLILADFNLPQYDGLSAFSYAAKTCPEIPFIFVSGRIGEDLAIEALRQGAKDYVLKDRLSRLTPAVHRAMEEVEERRNRERIENARSRAVEEMVQSREQLRALAARLQTIREEEKNRIAREVHDELGQALTALKIDLSWLETGLSEAGKLPHLTFLQEKVRSMNQLIMTTLQMVRKISSELRPGILDDLGLAAAIEWQAHEFQVRTGIRCEFRSLLEEIPLDKEAATAVFRIFQEILTNVARHSEAGIVTIDLCQKNDILDFEVKDNGKGISEAQISNAKSLGLMGMKERAMLLGGVVDISGGSKEGTTVRLQVPVPTPFLEVTQTGERAK